MVDPPGVSPTRMVELVVIRIDTTGTAGRRQGAHKEAGKRVSNRQETALCEGGDMTVHICITCESHHWRAGGDDERTDLWGAR